MKHKILSLLVLLLTAATSAWAQGDKPANPVISGETEFYDEVTVTITCTSANTDIYYTVGGTAPDDDTPEDIEYKKPITLTETTTIKAAGYNGKAWSDVVEVTFTKVQGPEVTFNEAKTEASFAMPAFDATATYELVRDITQKVDVEVRIDGTATERIRIAKDGDGHYKFVTKQENGWQFAAVDKLDNNKDLTDGELTYTFKMKEGNDYVAKNFKTDLCPGTWRLEATANADKPYEGIAYSKDIVLYDGYEITIDAGEYATFYKDEALYTEDENAELYTIASVTDTEVVLSDQIKVAPAKTPLLIYNKGEKDMTFILLPTEEQADAITAADQFKGTLEAKEMPASKEGEDYYVCTGKAFVWVMNEGTIAANKCWLEIIAQAAGARANTRSITGGSDTTGIDAATRDDIDGDYYDLQGRKVVKPNSKGIYIKNGKKVIKH